ncbi:GNAT family N-acetyltransferase [Flavilitoribacter nigricans]|uniref:Uncharacterized protein n=1 Tax=Flavilitoribacter nigricans (strain ATCC 23147 / DSM 23189 / NBRC 102662 / NCIMB 1420 / SS-2) TaxID=1122177 RepID=A0A2D0N3C8_FLAN2|nr:GNAT family N-acetyltransferase [Flavilitoribacter nigricans]PHN02649.1 hypothetical protein CRP01_31130 [Flavilitoribacter nigricans DSM 23189 = NBRC 102662]
MKLCAAHPCFSSRSLRKGESVPLSGSDCSFSLFTSIDSVPETYWELAQRSGDYFLQRDYLQLLEDSPPGNLRFSYLLFFHRGKPVGIAYGQLLEFRAEEHIRQQDADASRLRQLVAARVQLKVLICGNMLLTGQHGFYFEPEHAALAHAPLREALRKTADLWRSRGVTVNSILVKDLDEEQANLIENWNASEYHSLKFQPNMVLPIRPHWHSMDDYLEDLSSKYRVRYRRARKKLQRVQCLELNEEQIRTYEPELYPLYRKVAESSGFCVGYLAPDYFSELKAAAPRDFRLWAYFQSGELIGFCTAIRNGDELEAHFLGFGEEQQPYQLYLNMLYHLIEVAIQERVGQLVFSRTAMEIKSSVGAVAVPTTVFLLHHTSSLLNHLIPCLVGLLEPKDAWQPRHPFRTPEALGID